MRFITTLVLAAVWGTLVYAVHHSIGYEKATGYPALSSDLLWVGIAVMPLLLGAFVANKRMGIAKYLRWMCAAALAAEAGYLMIFTWLKILGGIPLFGVLLLLWSDMGGNKPSSKAAPPELSPEKLERKCRNRWINGSATAGLAALLVWWAWFHNPLPSDEQMIERFNANRAGFEQLVQGYRNYRRSDVFYEQSTNEVKALASRLGVYHVVEAQGASGQWYPSPYSEETRKILRSLYVRSVSNPAYNKEIMETLHKKIPALFNGFSATNDVLDVSKITSVIQLEIGTSAQPTDKFVLRYGGIYKGYYYFPQIPRMQEGHIVVPVCCHLDESLTIRLGQRVLNSLDGYPPDWKRGECVLKRIDDHWFIAMCRYG